MILRFLQLQMRRVEQARGPSASQGFTPVPELTSGDRTWLTWDEAAERELPLGPFPVDAGARHELASRCRAGRTSSCCTTTTRWSAGWCGAANRWPRPSRWAPRRSASGRTARSCCDSRSPSATERPERRGRSRRGHRQVLPGRAPGARRARRRRSSRWSTRRPGPGRPPPAAEQRRCWPVLAGDEGETADRAGVADHPVRPPRRGAGERRRPVRLHRDRRDPHPAGHDAHRRGEGRGSRHGSARGRRHRPLRPALPRGAAAPARHPARPAGGRGGVPAVPGPRGAARRRRGRAVVGPGGGRLGPARARRRRRRRGRRPAGEPRPAPADVGARTPRTCSTRGRRHG